MEIILVVDDDPGFRKLLETILTGEGYAVETTQSVKEAAAAAERRGFSLVISALRFRDGDGQQLLRSFAERSPETPVLMAAAPGNATEAVEAIRMGAAGHIGKPLSSPDEVRVLVRRALEQKQIGRAHV